MATDAAPVAAGDLTAAGIEVRAPFAEPVPGVDLVVKSPGVPGEAQPVAAARAEGIPVWSELELAARELRNPLIGVTGTNGKTTTTELAAHLLRAAGRPAIACGNQGTPLASLVDAVGAGDWLVVECSSFQLEDAHELHPRAAVLLNLAPDHLDRHGDLAAYERAKLRLFARQDPGDLALVPRGTVPPGRARVGHLDDGEPGPASAAWGAGGLHLAGTGLVARWEDVPLRGRHNRQNAMAAAALVRHAGLSPEEIAAGLATFPGVSHRLEVVAEDGGVLFVNDSKATNPEATLAALDAYPAGVHLILGGRAKGTPFGPLAQAARGPVVRAYLIGEAADDIAPALGEAGIEYERCGTLDVAVARAASRARRGEVVLLSPACASFDQFGGFEERGAAFARAVAALGAAPAQTRPRG